jgi:hypothetical protein
MTVPPTVISSDLGKERNNKRGEGEAFHPAAKMTGITTAN